MDEECKESVLTEVCVSHPREDRCFRLDADMESKSPADSACAGRTGDIKHFDVRIVESQNPTSSDCAGSVNFQGASTSNGGNEGQMPCSAVPPRCSSRWASKLSFLAKVGLFNTLSGGCQRVVDIVGGVPLWFICQRRLFV